MDRNRQNERSDDLDNPCRGRLGYVLRAKIRIDLLRPPCQHCISTHKRCISISRTFLLYLLYLLTAMTHVERETAPGTGGCIRYPQGDDWIMAVHLTLFASGRYIASIAPGWPTRPLSLAPHAAHPFDGRRPEYPWLSGWVLHDSFPCEPARTGCITRLH